MVDSAPFDAIVVGAGLTGALVASSLANHGLQVAVLEATRHLGGSLSHQPVLALLGAPMPLCELKAQVGEERAHVLWQLTSQNLDRLAALLDELGVPFNKTGSLRLAKDADQSQDFRNSVDELISYGHDVQLEDDSRYGGLTAIRTKEDFLFDPLDLIDRLLDHRNIQVEFNAEAHEIRHRADGNLAVWAHQHLLWGHQVILANGLHAVRMDSRLSTSLKATCVHTIVFEGHENLTQPLILDSGRIGLLPWDDRTYLIGWGECELDILWRLRSVAHQLCPDALVIDRFTKWVASGTDGLPSAGRITGEEEVYAISGLGPFGTNLALVVVDELVEFLLHHDTPTQFALTQ